MRMAPVQFRTPAVNRSTSKLLILVDLVGIEPMTSSMPWNWRNRKLLTDKAVKIGRVGKNRQNRHGLTPI
jgi:hypothetical protein